MTLAERLLEPDVAELPDWHAADVLNAPDPSNGTKRRDVPTWEAKAILLTTGEWGAITLLSRQQVTMVDPLAQAVMLAITARDALDPSITETIEATNPVNYAAVEGMLAGLVLAGVVSAPTQAALLALADTPKSWAEANGFPNGVTARDVGLARGAQA